MEMEDIYDKVKDLYNINLKAKGVKLPGKRAVLGQALCCLFESMGKSVSIDQIREYVLKNNIRLRGGDSCQVRHLALQCGFNVLKGGELNPMTKEKLPEYHFLLLDIENPYPTFIPKRRKVEMTGDDWTSLKKRYDNKCVNCGSEEGSPLRWNPHKITLLQQGHMDPRKSLTLDNVIPQCAICNQQYKNKAVFNDRGYVVEFCSAGFTQQDAGELC
jgi:hypothetical protein